MKLNQSRLKGARQQMMWHFLSPIFMALVLVGCSPETKIASHRDAEVAGDPNPAGTYALESVDGNKVPCTVKHEGHPLAVQSGSFTINSNGTCHSKMFLTGRASAIEVKGTYARNGSKLTMKWDGAGTTTGTIEDDKFILNNEGMVFAYRK